MQARCRPRDCTNALCSGESTMEVQRPLFSLALILLSFHQYEDNMFAMKALKMGLWTLLVVSIDLFHVHFCSFSHNGV